MSGLEVAKVVNGVFAIAVWDESWDSYNNCYLVLGDSGSVLVDSGKREHVDLLVQALSRLGTAPEKVKATLATHGHRDHVGGGLVFPRAQKFLHPLDWGPPTPKLELALTALPDEGPVSGFECILLGQHTTGSVALYHVGTKVLFSGDHICFFGAPLPEEGLVGRGSEQRGRFRDFVARWAEHWPPAGDEAERLAADLRERPPEDGRRHDLDLFQAGLVKLQRFDAAALCTGHGPVLVGEIPSFLDELVAACQRS